MKRVLLAIAVAACGGGKSTAPSSPTHVPDKPLDVTMRVRAERAGQKFGVGPGDHLKTGDFVEMFVTINEPAYLYVVQFFADGTSTVLYPDSGDKLSQPGAEIRIPEAADESFELDSRTGEENLYVLATREPVAKADASIAGAIKQIRVSDAAASDADPNAGSKSDPDAVSKTDPNAGSSAGKTDPDAGSKSDPTGSKTDPNAGTPDTGSKTDPNAGSKLDPRKPDPNAQTHVAARALKKVAASGAAPVREDSFGTLTSRGMKKTKRPDGAQIVQAAAEKKEDAVLVLRFNFQHE